MIMYHQLSFSRVPHGGARSLIACVRAFQCHHDRLGLLIVESASDGEDRSAVSAGGSGVLMVARCALIDHRPSLVSSVLLFTGYYLSEKQQKMGNGCKRAYRANQRGNCCFTRTEIPANVLETLAGRSLVPT